ncbi:MAG: M16 family metallopeptidase [Candidatus Acidiferrales bacterium]
MTRAIKRSLIALAAALLSGVLVQAQQPASSKPQPASASANPANQDQKNGTGVVPAGVKLVPHMPAAGTPRPFEFPKAATKTLANGLRVFVVTDRSQPAIAARLVILSAGTIKDPVATPGVAGMTATMLTQGTEKRSARDISEAIDFVGGSLNASAGKDVTAVTLDIVKKDLATGLDLMSDIVLRPAFRAEELDHQRQQLLSGLTVQYSDPEFLASAVFSREVYGNSPYGLPGEGTPDTVKKLTRDDLAKFHDANYAPNQSMLAFAGDITPEEAFAAAEKYFGPWPKIELNSETPAAPASASGVHIWLIDKPDAVQTQIRVGKLGIRRADPDFIPLQVTNRIFGGGYNSRLNTEVRIKKGLTYGAYSSFTPHRFAGAFVAGTFSRTDATVEATRLVVDLLTKMSTGQIAPQEIDFARDYLAGVYPIESETAEQVADRVLTVAAYGLPKDYNSTYPERIRGVTPAEVKAMAEKYFTTGDLDIVLAGNINAFRDSLKKAFPDAQYQEISFDQLDLLAPDLRKAKESAPAPTPESLEKGKQVLLAAAKAVGGNPLTAVSSISMTETGKLGGDNGTPLEVIWQIAYPNRSNGAVTIGGEHVLQVCDGKSAWIEVHNQTRDVTPFIGEFERGISLFGGGWGLYKLALAGEVTAQYTGEEEIAGKETQGVAVQAPFGAVKLYFDAETHLLAAARYKSATPQGTADNEQRWSDYRSVNGSQFAYGATVYRDGVKFSESTIQNVHLNPRIDVSIFSKPEAAPAK